MERFGLVVWVRLLAAVVFMIGCSDKGGKKKINDPCLSHTDCADNICHRGICASPNPKQNGAGCSGYGDCLSFSCIGGVCAPGQHASGSVCLNPQECSSRICVGGKCGGGSLDGGNDGARPDSASLDGGSPDSATPDSGSPDSATPDQATLDQIAADLPLDQAPPDQAKQDLIPDQPIPDQAKPDLISDQPIPDQLCPAGCLIALTCYKDGDLNPANSCQKCDLAQGKYKWTDFAGKKCVTWVAGSGGKGSKDGTLATATFNGFGGMHYASNKLYVVTAGGTPYTKIRLVDLTSKKVSTLAGDGTPGFLDGPAASARFNKPADIVRDESTGAVYVSDSGNHRIRGILSGYVSTISGTGSYGTQDGDFGLAQFYGPGAMSFDAKNRIIYVTSAVPGGKVRIRTLDLAAKKVATAWESASGGWGIAGMVYQSNYLYLTVSTLGGGGSSWIEVVDLKTKTSKTLTGAKKGYADGALGIARFIVPTGIAIDSSAQLTVADSLGYRLRFVTPGASGKVSTLAGTGSGGHKNGLATVAVLGRLSGIARDDKTGQVYMADNSNYRIRVYAP